MDKTTKFILGLIAVSLIGINVQMWNPKIIKDAHAVEYHEHETHEIWNFDRDVRRAIQTPNCEVLTVIGTIHHLIECNS